MKKGTMFGYIKNILKNKIIKNILVSLSILNIFKRNNTSDNNNDSSKLVTQIIIENNSCNKNKINLILLSKSLKLNNKKKLIKNYNVLNDTGIIEQDNNQKYKEYINKKLCYPNIFFNNYNKKEIKNFRKYLFYLYKQDMFMQKKFKKSRIFNQINTKKLDYFKAKYSNKADYIDQRFHIFYHYVNAIPKKEKEVKRHFIARLLVRQREKIMFFQGRPKNMYFKKLNKLNKIDYIKLKKNYLINFKKNVSEKKIYKKNGFLDSFNKFCYKTNLYKTRINHNLNNSSIKNYYKSGRDIYKYQYLKYLRSLRRKERLLKFKFFIRTRESSFLKVRYNKIRLKWVDPLKCVKTKYFYYSNYRYHRYWIKCKKIIIDREKVIDAEYNYIDPTILLYKLKLKEFDFNYESFEALASIIQDKGFSILLYVFMFIPIKIVLHNLKKLYYRNKVNKKNK